MFKIFSLLKRAGISPTFVYGATQITRYHFTLERYRTATFLTTKKHVKQVAVSKKVKSCLVRSRYCYTVASVVVCRLSVTLCIVA